MLFINTYFLVLPTILSRCVASFHAIPGSSFRKKRHSFHHGTRYQECRFIHCGSENEFSQYMHNSANDSVEALPSPSEMRVKEIQSELRQKGVSYKDCFDKESLVKRLTKAREGGGSFSMNEPSGANEQFKDNLEDSFTGETSHEGKKKSTEVEENRSERFNRQATQSELRRLKVSELRSMLGEKGIRWSNMIEKDDLVTALLNAMEIAASFSPSGVLVPGMATDLTEDQLATELNDESATTPLLLDIYATWCGPCQLMAPQLQAAAKELGNKVRVAKIDSDKYPAWSSKLNVGGLPTIIVFSKYGKEVKRQEGALMKDMLVHLVEPYL